MLGCEPGRAAKRRYTRRVLILSALYAAALLGATYAFKHHFVTGPLAWPVALLPALPIIAIFVALGRYLVEEQDEYVRMLAARQALWASGIAMSLATAWGFLESFGVVDHLPAYFVAIVWFAGLLPGSLSHRGQGATA